MQGPGLNHHQKREREGEREREREGRKKKENKLWLCGREESKREQ
jgi:hypothetical protein